MLVLMGAIWLAWLASWVNRVELRTRAKGTVAALGLGFEREGLRSRVIAAGTIGGSAVRVRWRTGWFGPSTDVAVAGAKWERVPEEETLQGWLKRRLGGVPAEQPTQGGAGPASGDAAASGSAPAETTPGGEGAGSPQPEPPPGASS